MIARNLLFLFAMFTIPCSAQSLELAKNGSSPYIIRLPIQPSAIDIKSATVLQDYFYRVTGVRLLIDKRKEITSPAFFIGHGSSAVIDKEVSGLAEDGFIIRVTQKNITIAGNQGKGTLYGVYTFIEKYMGCRKWDGLPAFTPKTATLLVSSSITEKQWPVIRYREAYFPPSFDDEYLDWHKLQRFETEWGLWGHSFFKLVPPKTYYKQHPEYFSLVNGKREPVQLCLSNATVLKIAIDRLQKLINENQGAKYWSVSPNDDIGNCECDKCASLDLADGGPQGSLIYFVNAVAAHFPNKIITTLAYGYSARATIKTRPAQNVAVMVSSIDAYRTKPLETEPTAGTFRKNLLQWKEKASRLFVWDYGTQFTNYLTPFPVTNTFGPNIRFLIQYGATGIFAQGSENSYSDMAELKSYVLAKLLWNPEADADNIIQEFLQGYYGRAAPAINEYLFLLNKNLSANNTQLDIYGNPVNDYTGYLSPQNMDAYSQLMDKAEQLAEADKLAYQRVHTMRLSQEYVYLQQSKFFGKDRHGVFQKNNEGTYVIRPGLEQRVERFTDLCKEMGVKELSEGGISPEKYKTEWKSIITAGPKTNLAANSVVQLSYAFVPEYPSKKERTLVDETPGYADFSYNWLCFYGVPLEAVIDMGAIKKVNTISATFLEDARHWIFRPASVSVEISADGIQYRSVNIISSQTPEEDYTIGVLPFRFTVNDNIRYIRVNAANQPALPAWRYHKYKKPMLACDEIWVE
jgi:hypothetical protein